MARNITAAVTLPVSEDVRPAARPPAAPMDAMDRERLLSGAHHDPHALLGAHAVPGGVVFRALRPDRKSVV